MQSQNENQAVSNFREYLRINTMQPDPDYESAVVFLKKQAKELDLPFKVIECHPGKPVVIMTWLGSEPQLPTVLLNSHIDVVPVFEDQWKYEPFSAHKDEKGDIYARGSQDMKCVGIQYLEAIRRLQAEGKQFKRTIHVSFVPDEEIGGALGMGLFVESAEFQALNIGFGLDEGLANPTEAFTLFYGERCPWWVKVTCKGDPGHGSRFIEDSAAEKLRKVINSFLAFRDSEEAKLKNDPKLRLGDVTTTNMNMISGGVQPNVVPAELTATFDIRITPSMDLEKFDAMIARFCSEAGVGVSHEFLQRDIPALGFSPMNRTPILLHDHNEFLNEQIFLRGIDIYCDIIPNIADKFVNQNVTSISPDDPWFSAFKAACDKHNVKLEPEIFPAATDSRFLRKLGIPALGFSPMNRTPILLHDHNEFLNEQIFLRGIDIYCDIIPNMADVPSIK